MMCAYNGEPTYPAALVQRLRQMEIGGLPGADKLAGEAADAIERLAQTLATLEHQDGMTKASNAENYQKWQKAEAESSRLAQENERLRAALQALQALVEKVKAISAHPDYLGMIGVAYAHGMTYDGPNWAEELKRAEAALGAAARAGGGER